MRYHSTRGQSRDRSFEAVVLEGLAPDGGLYVPTEMPPPLSSEDLNALQGLTFAQLATRLLRLFITLDEMDHEDLVQLCETSFSCTGDQAVFSHAALAPLRRLDEKRDVWLLELFHGPTLAFKDVALQFLGNLFEYFLARRARRNGRAARVGITVLGATSGDTGGAAIYGLRGKANVKVVILYPHGKVSQIQAKQMTSVLDENVHNLAVEGTFDDCQDIVKALFRDPKTRRRHRLAAINSINLARILVQTLYYFYAYVNLVPQHVPADRPWQVVVPTGNFGDALAAHYARRLGLPLARVGIATNRNAILHRFLCTGIYQPTFAVETLSPAMDIQTASNFERFLYELAEERCDILTKWMTVLKETGRLQVSDSVLGQARAAFVSVAVTDEQVLTTMRLCYFRESGRDHGQKPVPLLPLSAVTPYSGSIIIDPHTAVGVTAALRLTKPSDALQKSWLTKDDNMRHFDDVDTRKATGQTFQPSPFVTVCLATAHPAKFPEAIRRAFLDVDASTSPSFTWQSLLKKSDQASTVTEDEQERRALDWLEVRGYLPPAIVRLRGSIPVKVTRVPASDRAVLAYLEQHVYDGPRTSKL